MTVATETAKCSYVGDGNNKEFAVTFPFSQNNEIAVYKINDSGTETLLTLNTDYSVTGAGDPSGGTVILTGTAPASSETIIIIRDVNFIQDVNFTGNTDLPEETLESALDRFVMMAQQLREKLDRALTVSQSYTIGDLPEIDQLLSYFEDQMSVSSATSLAVGTGAKAFTVAKVPGYLVNDFVMVSSSGDATKWMWGQITSRGETSITVTVAKSGGTGTAADWVIRISGPQGPTGQTGPGTGDLLSTNNLNDVANLASAFATIKQTATESVTGVVELATTAEAAAGTDTTRAVTAAGIAAAMATIDGGAM